MLTGRLIRVRYARDRLIPSYVDAGAPEWQEIGERLLTLFRGREGATRGELEDDVKESFDADPQTLVHQGLAKVLEDRCEFEVVSDHPPEQLREMVFSAATKRRAAGGIGAEAKPEGGTSPQGLDRQAVLQEVAAALQVTPEVVDRGLFADLKSEQRLVKFGDISAERLLQRYNVALAQSILLRATSVTVLVRNEPPQRYRQLLRAVKFHRLIADIERVDEQTYRLRLDGPLSLFSATQKYGLQLALFLPSVLLCTDFELDAELRWGAEKKNKSFKLTPKDGLVSHLADAGMHVPDETAMFAPLFAKRVKDWELSKSADVLPLGDGFWVPDYRLVHKKSGKAVYLEILGFWRKASIEKHLARLRQHATFPFVLAVSEQLQIGEEALEEMPAGVHRYKAMPLPDAVAKLAQAALK